MNKYIIRQLPPIFPVYMSDVYTYITFLNHATPPRIPILTLHMSYGFPSRQGGAGGGGGGDFQILS